MRIDPASFTWLDLCVVAFRAGLTSYTFFVLLFFFGWWKVSVGGLILTLHKASHCVVAEIVDHVLELEVTAFIALVHEAFRIEIERSIMFFSDELWLKQVCSNAATLV